jgi:hypothetical protein
MLNLLEQIHVVFLKLFGLNRFSAHFLVFYGNNFSKALDLVPSKVRFTDIQNPASYLEL